MNKKEYARQDGRPRSGLRSGPAAAGTSSEVGNRGRVPHPLRAHVTAVAVILLILAAVLDLSVRPTAAGGRLRKAKPDDEAYLLINTDVSPDVVVSGSNVTYTVSVTNEGTAPAAPFVVNDTLPAGTTFVSCHATGGGICGGSDNERTINFDTLAPESSATITLVATVECSLADGVELDNTATLHLLTPDPEDEEGENETMSILVSNPPPSITGVAASPATLSPPNHKMVSVTIGYNVTDNCGPVVTKLRVASNEPANGTGDGDTAPDWEVLDEHHVLLRAERSGNGSGRTYTVTITATDSANQSSSRQVSIKVPKSAKK